MKRKHYSITALFVFTLMVAHLSLCDSLPAQAAEKNKWYIFNFYNYDTNLPMNAVEKVHKETDAYTSYYFEIDTRHGKRFSGYYSLPKNGTKPYPLVVLMCGYGGSKNMLYEAVDPLSERGYAAMSIDPEYHGDREAPGKAMYSKLPYSSRDAMIQTVIDYRRSIDYMALRDDIDIDRVGYIGGSMGGIIGAALSAMEPRLKATALAVGGADWGYLLKHSIVADVLGLRRGDNPLDTKLFRRIVTPADPIHLAHLISPRPVLMLNAKHDILVNPGSNKLLYNRLKEPKKIVWFDEDHDLGFENAYPYIDAFFADYLIGDKDPAEMGAQVIGHETKPFDMERKKPLPEPRKYIPLEDLLAYETFLPLVPEDAEKITFTDGRADFVFLSTHDKKVPGYAAIPGGGNSLKGIVIYVHEVGGNKDDAQEVMKAATDAGYMFVAFDLEYHGGRAVEGRSFFSPYAVTDADAVLQTTFDIRRAIDFAEQELMPAATGEQSAEGESKKIIVAAKGTLSSFISGSTASIDPRISETIYLPGNFDDDNISQWKKLNSSEKGQLYYDMTKWMNMLQEMPKRDDLFLCAVKGINIQLKYMNKGIVMFDDNEKALNNTNIEK